MFNNEVGIGYGITSSTDINGDSDKSIYLNGIDNYIYWPNYPELNLGLSDFSISLWIKF